jgi:hypothetical protein
MEGSDPAHLFGTDQLGRDYLSRLIWGCRISMLIGAAPPNIACHLRWWRRWKWRSPSRSSRPFVPGHALPLLAAQPRARRGQGSYVFSPWVIVMPAWRSSCWSSHQSLKTDPWPVRCDHRIRECTPLDVERLEVGSAAALGGARRLATVERADPRL